jgi:hypothetical protein|tara:strand:- start:1192 stop:2256 length:1065 start_codon:yes stop_codon:yes gene_type:complete
MAININTVYKTVLLILNKEERGYVTPDEFSKIANQVQLEIFEQYSDDLNQQLRVPQSDTDYADRVANIDEKISIFKTFGNTTYNANVSSDIHFELKQAGNNLPIYRLGTVTYKEEVELQRLQRMEFYNIQKSPLTKSTESFPTYLLENNKLYVKPSTITSAINVSYLRIPSEPRWGYYIGGVGQYIYDSSIYNVTSVNSGPNSLTSSVVSSVANYPIDGVYRGIVGDTSGFVITGSGSGLDISITITNGTVSSVSVNEPGINYLPEGGQQITVAGSVFDNPSAPVLPGDVQILLRSSDFNGNSTYGSTQIELDVSEQTNFTLRTLFYFGVVIKDPQIIQVAASQVQRDEINEKS